MKEGWRDEEYLILFEKSEVASATERYQLERFLPGFEIIGLQGWDDMIVRRNDGRTFSVPTIPISEDLLAPFEAPLENVSLVEDSRFTGQIKWYIKPVVLGGDPNIGENLKWVTHQLHGELVVWWNILIRDIDYLTISLERTATARRAALMVNQDFTTSAVRD